MNRSSNKPKFNVFNIVTGELAVMRKLPKAPYRPKNMYKITFHRGERLGVKGFTFALQFKGSTNKVVGRYWVRL